VKTLPASRRRRSGLHFRVTSTKPSGTRLDRLRAVSRSGPDNCSRHLRLNSLIGPLSQGHAGIYVAICPIAQSIGRDRSFPGLTWTPTTTATIRQNRHDRIELIVLVRGRWPVLTNVSRAMLSIISGAGHSRRPRRLIMSRDAPWPSRSPSRLANRSYNSHPRLDIHALETGGPPNIACARARVRGGAKPCWQPSERGCVLSKASKTLPRTRALWIRQATRVTITLHRHGFPRLSPSPLVLQEREH